MKQIFIVLLIAAAGLGVYYYVNKSQPNKDKDYTQSLNGTWKIDSLKRKSNLTTLFGKGSADPSNDSSLRQFDFEFKKNGLVLQTRNGNILDTSTYHFADSTHVLIWSGGDTTRFRLEFSSDSSRMTLDNDSISFYFRRPK